MATENTPDTLLGAIVYFADVDVATMFMASMRWADGVRCPHCESVDCSYVQSRRIWQCKNCRKQFSVKVGSIFEDSPIPLSKWLPAMWMLVNCKNGVSSYEIARDLGVTQKTAWFMLHRLRLAIQAQSFDKMDGNIECDETFIGGKARNMHYGKPSYVSLESDYTHNVIDHAEAYVDGQVHTNGLENFWSLLKRAIKGTYVSVEPFHLFRYLDEQAYRFNNRKGTDASRFLAACKSVFGRRLTYTALTGNELPETC